MPYALSHDVLMFWLITAVFYQRVWASYWR